jgi:hypothetical protein
MPGRNRHVDIDLDTGAGIKRVPAHTQSFIGAAHTVLIGHSYATGGTETGPARVARDSPRYTVFLTPLKPGRRHDATDP